MKRLAALVSTVLVVGCTETVTEVPTDSDELYLSPRSTVVGALAAPAAGSNHFVVFNDGVPDGFEAMVEASGASIEATYPEIGVAVVSGLEGAAAEKQLRAVSGAAFVELEPELFVEEPLSMSEPFSNGVLGHSVGDPEEAHWRSFQWNMDAIDASGAWAAGRLGASSTTVAILDTGIDYLHNDLVGQVDLSRSASFVSDDDALVDLYFPGRHHVTDLNFHGTHVASLVAARGYTIAGVAPGVTLIGVKVCDVFGSCPGASVLGGAFHAIAAGADVANLSFGGSFSKRDFPGAVAVYQRLINYANRSGLTLVVAAGNAAVDLDHDKYSFQAYCGAANVICVSATGPVSGETFSPGPHEAPDTPASYSNFGRSAISVAAPGGYVTGVIGSCSTSSLVIPPCQTSPFFYIGLGGTSMASPHAAGVAALIVEDVGRRPGRVRQALMQSADDLGQRGTDPFYGRGRVNAAAAVGAN